MTAGPKTAEAEAPRLPAGDGRAALEAPPNSGPGPDAIAAAEPAKPDPAADPGPSTAAATEPAPVAADPALASTKSEDRLAREAGERRAGPADSAMPRPHEEEDDASKPGAHTAEAKPANVSPDENKPSAPGGGARRARRRRQHPGASRHKTCRGEAGPGSAGHGSGNRAP